MYDQFKTQINAATKENPLVFAVLSQDATSASIQGRTRGFAQELKKLVEADSAFTGSVSISGGYAAINEGDEATATIKIQVTVGATPDIADMTNASVGVLNTENLAGVFCSNEGAVNGFLAALNAGSVLPAGVKVIGFDAGSGQKTAVKNGTFLGSITQDPYQIGYKAVEMAVKAAKGEAVADVDTGAKWYDATNIDSAEIKDLVYD